MYQLIDEYKTQKRWWSITPKQHKNLSKKIKIAIPVIGVLMVIATVSCPIQVALTPSSDIFSTDSISNTTSNTTSEVTVIIKSKEDIEKERSSKCLLERSIPMNIIFLLLVITECFASYLVRTERPTQEIQLRLYIITMNGMKSKTDWGNFLTRNNLYDPRLLCYSYNFANAQK